MFAQIIAICIFVTMFLLIILDKFERHYITLGSGALVLVLVFGVCMRSMSAIWETLNLGAFFQSTFWYGASEESTAGINWSTILFIAGMMIMVEGLGKAGFFRWLCLTLAKLVHYRTVPLLICFMSLSAFLSMFIDSITVVLFLATVTLELNGQRKVVTSVGNGRLDAVANAIQSATGMEFHLENYSEHSLDEGSTSRAASYVGLTWGDGTVTWGAGTDTDIIVAGVKALVGKIATGDLFVGDSATKAAIEAKCAPDCVEMEGAAVSQIAAKNGVPCVILRAMSDNADEDGHEVLVVKKFSIAAYVATATQIVAAMVEAL